MPRAARRSSASRDAILTACLALVREPDRRLSIEAIAREAGVGKQTIYRWWPSIGAVLVEAVTLERDRWPIDFADTGDVFADLARVVGAVAEQMAKPDQAAILTALIGEMQRDAVVRDAFNEAVFDPIRQRYRTRLAAARATGEISTAVSDDDLLDLAFGPLWFRLLTRPDAVTPAFGQTIVATLTDALRSTSAP